MTLMPWQADPTVTVPSPLSEATLAYLAGLLDGEGCVFARSRGATGLQISMVTRPVVEWLHETFSGNFRVSKRPPNKTAYTWALQRQADLQYLLPLIRPYLRVKGEAVDRLLAYLEFVQAQKPRGQKDRKQHAAFMAERDKLARKVGTG